MTFPGKPAPIIVVGSANQDYIVRVATPPTPGETVLATSLLKQPGGKGANQAVAAARLGAPVSLIACVGDDADGAALRAALRSEGVDTAHLQTASAEPTGLALVSVDDSGENCITVVPGANFAIDVEHVRAAVTMLVREACGGLVVVQGELPFEIIQASVGVAHEAGARVILNLAPYRTMPDETIALCDPLVVNEAEAAAMVGRPVHDAESAARAAGELLQTAHSVVITLGADGAFWADSEASGHARTSGAPDVVDTTGAGDAFVGALAVLLASGGSLEEAVKLGVLAGTYAVASAGAQSSYPRRADLEPMRALPTGSGDV